MTKLMRLLYYLTIPVVLTLLLNLSWSEFLVTMVFNAFISYRVEKIHQGCS